jgi:hypothetical protein
MVPSREHLKKPGPSLLQPAPFKRSRCIVTSLAQLVRHIPSPSPLTAAFRTFDLHANPDVDSMFLVWTTAPRAHMHAQ